MKIEAMTIIYLLYNGLTRKRIGKFEDSKKLE